MMDRRVRKLRKTFKDPEVAGPSATIIAARMLDAMTDGASPASLAGTASARLKGVQSPLVMAGDPAADVGAALMARRSSSASDGGAAAAAAVAAAHAGAGVGAGAGDGGESKSNVRSPLTRVKLDSLPNGGAGSRRNLPALPASAVMKGVAAGLSPAASPMAGSTDSLDARLLQHTASFAKGSAVPREMSYGAANTTTGVGLVRVVTATYLDHLLSLSEVLSYLHEALELQVRAYDGCACMAGSVGVSPDLGVPRTSRTSASATSRCRQRARPRRCSRRSSRARSGAHSCARWRATSAFSSARPPWEHATKQTTRRRWGCSSSSSCSRGWVCGCSRGHRGMCVRVDVCGGAVQSGSLLCRYLAADSSAVYKELRGRHERKSVLPDKSVAAIPGSNRCAITDVTKDPRDTIRSAEFRTAFCSATCWRDVPWRRQLYGYTMQVVTFDLHYLLPAPSRI